MVVEGQTLSRRSQLGPVPYQAALSSVAAMRNAKGPGALYLTYNLPAGHNCFLAFGLSSQPHSKAQELPPGVLWQQFLLDMAQWRSKLTRVVPR